MTTEEKSIKWYLISEIIIVASIIFCVFNLIGMKFENREFEKLESTKPLCDCSDVQDALKPVAYEKYRLSGYRYETIYKHYYLEKTIANLIPQVRNLKTKFFNSNPKELTILLLRLICLGAHK